MQEPATIPELFDALVQQHADRTALVHQGSALTYQQLQHRAETVASWLSGHGVGIETVVGVYAERSAELIVALLGVLKAGGTYVCLAPDHPRERVEQILADAGAVALITTGTHRGAAQEFGLPVIDTVDAPAAGSPAVPRNGPVSAPDALAYIIFTSGSTGRPKGVGITHRNLLGLVRGQTYAAFGPEETYLQLSPTSFDASAFEIWGALLSGARLIVPAASYQALDELPEVLRAERVTMLLLTPPLFHELVRRRIDSFDSVRRLIVGAEAMSLPVARTYLGHAQSRGASFANVYGPTEATTLASCFEITGLEGPEAAIPIGSAINGATVRLLDNELRQIGPGETGQVHIGGPGVARGYVGQPGLTARSFVADPYSATPGARMYATGDLGRLRPDGEIEFLGRGDGQVKIRGHRVELGEVESALGRCPGVLAVAVTARATSVGSHQLVAHVVAADPEDLTLADALAQYAAAHLPGYLRPSAIRATRLLPLTASGKTDRKALAALADEAATVPSAGQATPTAASGDARTSLTSIWQDVLSTTDLIGLDDDFFALGGDSLLAIRVIANAEDAGLEIALADLFATPTIRALTPGFEETGGPARGPAAGIPTDPAEALTPAQQSLRQVWTEVLGADLIGLDDDFFALGGDSLLAIRVIANAEDAGLEIALADLFATPTIRALTPGSEDTAETGGGEALQAGTSAGGAAAAYGPGIEDAYPATMMQLGLLFEAEADPDSGLYIDVISRRILGRFDEALLSEALRQTLRRHPALRTAFDLATGDTPMQLVHSDPVVNLRVSDLREESAAHAAEAVRRDEQAAARPFEPGDTSLIRFRVTWTGPLEYHLTYGFHHAVMDGWSESVFAGDLLRSYDALLRGIPLPDEESATGYAEFVELEQRSLASEETRLFWKERCAALRPASARPVMDTAGANRHTLVMPIPREIVKELRHRSRDWRVPFKTVVLAGHLAALGRLTSTSEPVTGLITNGRPETAAGEQLVGLFLNVLPVSGSVMAPWRTLAEELFTHERAMLAHRRFPYPALLELSDDRPFDTAFNFVQFHRSAALSELTEVRVTGTRIMDKTSFPLAFDAVLSPDGEDLNLEAAAATGTFSAADLEAVVAAHLAAYRSIADDAAGGVGRRV
ncbi:amino acid adenylation domain-containing protein [Streptomyces sp. LN699]|uniref:amino acid adenylation domain-containing protein n=1 Tax=Streptomyces sp. LN699 TaxID=3112981 RepID=UPI003715F96F